MQHCPVAGCHQATGAVTVGDFTAHLILWAVKEESLYNKQALMRELRICWKRTVKIAYTLCIWRALPILSSAVIARAACPPNIMGHGLSDRGIVDYYIILNSLLNPPFGWSTKLCVGLEVSSRALSSTRLTVAESPANINNRRTMRWQA